MAGSTCQLLMEGFYDKACPFAMIEAFGLLGGMAKGAIVRNIMATDTVLMGVFLDTQGVGLGIMATAAAFLFVTVDTFDAKQIDMFFVVEGHDRSIGHLFGLINPLFGGFNVGV